MLMRFGPFREMDRIAQMASEAAQTPRSFPLDAFRRGDEFIVQLDLPGVDASSIELTVERNVLTVKGERRFARQEGDEIIATERPHGFEISTHGRPQTVEARRQSEGTGAQQPEMAESSKA